MKTNIYKTGIIILCFSAGLMSCSKSDYGPSLNGTHSVATLAPEKVTTTTALVRGTIQTEATGNVIENGIYLSETTDQLVPDPSRPGGFRGIKYAGVSEGDGHFFVSLANLKPDTRYNFVAYATTVSGTFYGQIKMLVTSIGTVNDADGNQYQTIKIGDQIWMRENLKAEHYADQTLINGHYDLDKDEMYGKHYSWDAANAVMKGVKSGSAEGVCPTGWHLPSDNEWQTMLSYVGVPSSQLNSLSLIGDNQAMSLKDAGSDFWPNEKVNNQTGFSILPADICKKCSTDLGCQTAFWTSTPGIFYGFQNESEKIMRGNHPDCMCGFSIRCVKN